MSAPDAPPAEPTPSHARSYRSFLQSRWAPRAKRLAAHAFVGNLVIFALDVFYTRLLPETPPIGLVAAFRLPWLLLPAVGYLIFRAAPTSRFLPAIVVTFSVAWTWGTDWAYFALGLGSSNVQALVMVLCFITAATFIPVRLGQRLAIFAVMAAGHVALDLTSPRAAPVTAPVLDALVLLALAAVQTVIFEGFSVSQRRRFILHRDLLAKVNALEASRLRADRSAAALGGLAARVAHDVNNPLAAVKVNVRWLGDAQDPAERREVSLETLEAVERIARSVAALEPPAVTPAGHEAAPAVRRAGRG